MEEAIKKQMDWRREQKDDWRWLTWEYVSGEAGPLCGGHVRPRLAGL